MQPRTTHLAVLIISVLFYYSMFQQKLLFNGEKMLYLTDKIISIHLYKLIPIIYQTRSLVISQKYAKRYIFLLTSLSSHHNSKRTKVMSPTVIFSKCSYYCLLGGCKNKVMTDLCSMWAYVIEIYTSI